MRSRTRTTWACPQARGSAASCTARARRWALAEGAARLRKRQRDPLRLEGPRGFVQACYRDELHRVQLTAPAGLCCCEEGMTRTIWACRRASASAASLHRPHKQVGFGSRAPPLQKCFFKASGVLLRRHRQGCAHAKAVSTTSTCINAHESFARMMQRQRVSALEHVLACVEECLAVL